MKASLKSMFSPEPIPASEGIVNCVHHYNNLIGIQDTVDGSGIGGRREDGRKKSDEFLEFFDHMDEFENEESIVSMR